VYVVPIHTSASNPEVDSVVAPLATTTSSKKYGFVAPPRNTFTNAVPVGGVYVAVHCVHAVGDNVKFVTVADPTNDHVELKNWTDGVIVPVPFNQPLNVFAVPTVNDTLLSVLYAFTDNAFEPVWASDVVVRVYPVHTSFSNVFVESVVTGMTGPSAAATEATSTSPATAATGFVTVTVAAPPALLPEALAR
jgi:hypothetical protein